MPLWARLTCITHSVKSTQYVLKRLSRKGFPTQHTVTRYLPINFLRHERQDLIARSEWAALEKWDQQQAAAERGARLQAAAEAQRAQREVLAVQVRGLSAACHIFERCCGKMALSRDDGDRRRFLAALMTTWHSPAHAAVCSLHTLTLWR